MVKVTKFTLFLKPGVTLEVFVHVSGERKKRTDRKWNGRGEMLVPPSNAFERRTPTDGKLSLDEKQKQTKNSTSTPSSSRTTRSTTTTCSWPRMNMPFPIRLVKQKQQEKAKTPFRRPHHHHLFVLASSAGPRCSSRSTPLAPCRLRWGRDSSKSG